MSVILEVPILSQELSIVKVDAFSLYGLTSDKAKVCSYKYRFDEFLIYDQSSKNKPCLRRFHRTPQINPGTVILITEFDSNCLEHVEASTFFEIDNCESVSSFSKQKTIQTKIVGEYVYLYCLFNHAQIGGRVGPCNNTVYRISRSTPFMVNNLNISSETLDVFSPDLTAEMEHEVWSKRIFDQEVEKDLKDCQVYIQEAVANAEAAQKISEKIGNFFGNAWSGIVGFFSDIIHSIENKIVQLLVKIVTIVGAILLFVLFCGLLYCACVSICIPSLCRCRRGKLTSDAPSY